MFLFKTKTNNDEAEYSRLREICCLEHRKLKEYLGYQLKTPAPLHLARLPRSTHPVRAASFSEKNMLAIKKFYYHAIHLDQPTIPKEFDLRLDFPINPSFIRRDGIVLDADLAVEMQELSISTPHTRVSFLQEDILPCNTVIYLMQELVNILNGHDLITENVVYDHRVQVNYKKLTPDDIKSLERFYKSLTRSYQRLFNIVCRSPSGQILEDAVFLPNGLLYERSVVLKWLADATLENKPCYIPNSLIEFSADDITRCHFSKIILEQIQALIVVTKHTTHVRYTAATAAQPQKYKIALPPKYERGLNILLQEVEYLNIGLRNIPAPQKMPVTFIGIIMEAIKPAPHTILLRLPNLLNPEMLDALESAKEALIALDYEAFKRIKRDCPKCTLARIPDAIDMKLSALHTYRYANFSSRLGVKYQPGWYLHSMLNKVERALRYLTSYVKAEEQAAPVLRHNRHRSF
jgi:hypothetical protein